MLYFFLEVGFILLCILFFKPAERAFYISPAYVTSDVILKSVAYGIETDVQRCLEKEVG